MVANGVRFPDVPLEGYSPAGPADNVDGKPFIGAVTFVEGTVNIEDQEFQIKKELVREHYLGSLDLFGKAVARVRAKAGGVVTFQEAVEMLYAELENQKVSD